jgi:hypothetical protein
MLQFADCGAINFFMFLCMTCIHVGYAKGCRNMLYESVYFIILP